MFKIHFIHAYFFRIFEFSYNIHTGCEKDPGTFKYLKKDTTIQKNKNNFFNFFQKAIHDTTLDPKHPQWVRGG